jgi:EAL domain-containing protein (putative c-di-GMP-specific phosphodiesterase class I)
VEFIKLAEESGLIVALTDWVLQTACEHLRRRADEGLPEVHISVNLASPSFAREGLAEQLNVLLARHGLQAGSLTLEVTESMLMLDMEQAAARLQQLRERGFELSLDDFGTGTRR